VYSLACWGDETDAVQVSLGCSSLTSPVIMDSVKADPDLRFEHAKDGFTRVAVQAAVIAAFVGLRGNRWRDGEG
jgi:hypothetical protein